MSIIEIKNLGKKYNISHQKGGYVALRDVMANVFKNPFKFIFHKTRQITGREKKEEFWALKDINFTVKKGEVIGIIGHNGAGKSTLLKILSEITTPTTGEVIINGSVGSLLEVGTGFHPELTGRENIMLNGAILGMTKKEIEKKFNQIVKFAGIDKFLDTPVKRYSSGMYVRLAFSVAAHMDPDILLIDEVLAVGDAEFQKKCLGKMDDITKKEGRTILFVSHNMSAIQQLCQKCILLENGKIKKLGKTKDVIEEYSRVISQKIGNNLDNRIDRTGNGYIKFKKIELLGLDNKIKNIYSIGEDIYINLKIQNLYSEKISAKLYLNIRTFDMQELISCDSSLKNIDHIIQAKSENNFTCKIYSPPLNFGKYYINIGISRDNKMEDRIQFAAEFSIETGCFDNRISTNQFPVLAKFDWFLNN